MLRRFQRHIAACGKYNTFALWGSHNCPYDDWPGCVVNSTDVSNEPDAHFSFNPCSFKTPVTICQLIRRYNPQALIFEILSVSFATGDWCFSQRSATLKHELLNSLSLSVFCFCLCRLYCWPQGSLGATCLSTSITIVLSFQTLNSVHRNIFVVRNVDHANATYIVKYSTGESLVFILTLVFRKLYVPDF